MNRKRYLLLSAVVLILASALAGVHLFQSAADSQPLSANRRDPGTPSPSAERDQRPAASAGETGDASVTENGEADTPPSADADAVQTPGRADGDPIRRRAEAASGQPKAGSTVADATPMIRQSREASRIDPPPAAADREPVNPNRPRDREPIPRQMASTGKQITAATPPTEHRIRRPRRGDVRPSTNSGGRPKGNDAGIEGTIGNPSEEIAPFYRKALANHRDGRLPEAMRLYRKVLRYDPNHWGAMMNLAAIDLSLANYREAQGLLQRLERAHPRPQGVLLNLAIAAMGTGNHQTALAYLDRARRESDAPVWDIRFHRAVAYSQMNRPQDALGLYEAALVERPDDPRLRFNLAVTCDRLGLYEKALPHYEAAAKAEGAPMGMDEAAIARRIRTLRQYLDNTRQREKRR